MTGTESYTQPYGPNTPRVRRFLVQLAALGPSQRAAVLDAYHRVCTTPPWARAELALAAAIAHAGRTDAQAALGGPLLQLVGATGSAADGADVELEPIAEPALAALLALVASDLLTSEQVETLYAPFAQVIPATAL